jgi:hypothetical protein
MSEDTYTKYTKVSYAGRKLLDNHSLNEEGIWQIFGEDPNCDFGGAHHQPELGIVEGKLEDVIRYAVSLSGFWAWGAGGDIKFLGKKVPKVDMDTIGRRQELKREAQELEERLKAVRQELGKE